MSDLSTIYDFTLSLNEAAKINEFRVVYSTLRSALEISVPIPYTLNGRSFVFLRPDEQYTQYQRQENTFGRPADKDRVFPLDTVELKKFNTDHDTDLDEARIHVGPYSDEYARSFNALALAIGTDIFFRNNAFNTSNEEGRKTLAHELTHVAQYKEGRINNNNSVEELEAEADIIGNKEAYTDDPYCLITVDNKRYRIRKSETEDLAAQIADSIERKIEEERWIMSEERYLRLLIEYEDMLKRSVLNGIFDAF